VDVTNSNLSNSKCHLSPNLSRRIKKEPSPFNRRKLFFCALIRQNQRHKPNSTKDYHKRGLNAKGVEYSYDNPTKGGLK